ncbi:MAG: Rieske (2Fe-2S) protein [Bacteroidota bacterium]|nr:Rieske (2Fe-2S) protein [Bacteroidota bacterium]
MTDFSVDPDIAKAKTLHTDFYKRIEIFEQCKEKIFAPSWQFIGNTDLVPQHNDLFPFTLLENYLDEPLLLTKDKNNDIHLLSNVCTHRGNIIAEKPCAAAHLRCRYHGRKFDLNGKFMAMPEFKEVENFPCDDDNLTQLNIFKWSKFLFTTLNQKLVANIFLKDMIERVSWMPLDEFVFRPELS